MAYLYEFEQAAAQLYELLLAEEIDEQTLQDSLEAMGANDKIESCCQVIKQLAADAAMYEAEEKRCAERKKACKNGIERIKNNIFSFMLASSQTEIKTGTFNVKTAYTKAVHIIDESAIPEQYLISQPAKVNKTEIGKALRAGETVEGCELQENGGVRIR